MCRNHSHATVSAAEGASAQGLRFFVFKMAQELTLDAPPGVKVVLDQGTCLYFLPDELTGAQIDPALLHAVGMALAEFMAEAVADAAYEGADYMNFLGGA